MASGYRSAHLLELINSIKTDSILGMVILLPKVTTSYETKSLKYSMWEQIPEY